MVAKAEPRTLRLFILSLVVALSPALALRSSAWADSPEELRAREQLEAVNRDILALKERLQASRADQRKEQAQLMQVDLAIQDALLKYRDLERQRESYQAELATLETRRSDYLDSLGERLGQLAEQVNAAYRTTGQSRLKLVLNQDDPDKLGRLLAYYDYLNRAQIERISALKSALSTLERMQQSIDAELRRLKEVQKEQQGILEELQHQRESRGLLLADLSSQISSEEARLAELQRNQQDLEALLERLSDVLADIPQDLGSRSGVAEQKRRLPMPVKGPVKHAYGQKRVGGMHWQGWLIGVERGTEARAIAYGRVAFADWLRGYGLLMIIDHGQGYLSLYGYNESLLEDVGSWVEAGQVISVVGDNPGSGQGLYFELRKNGKAIDPAAWLAR